MRTRFLLILVAALSLSGECVQVGPPKPPQYARVEVAAFSILGERLTDMVFSLTEIGTEKGPRSDFRGAVSKRIPFGVHTLGVSGPGFRAVQREVRIDQPDVSIRAQLSASMECVGFAEITGSVRPAPLDRELWVKLVPARGSGDVETRVGRNGNFLVSGLEVGDYFLFVVEGKTIVSTRTVQVFGSERIDVDLEKQ